MAGAARFGKAHPDENWSISGVLVQHGLSLNADDGKRRLTEKVLPPVLDMEESVFEALEAFRNEFAAPASLPPDGDLRSGVAPDRLGKGSLLAEIENLIDNMPPRATIRHETPENRTWFGRVSAAVERWNPSKSALVKEHLDLFFSNGHARETAHGLNKLLILLDQARADLRLPPRSSAMEPRARTRSGRVFIGHGGGSLVWYQLKDFLCERLGLPWSEFNSEAAAGISTTERLQTLLEDADFAFLVMTAEDGHADGSTHARENVVHEIGLFQGKLGFKRAIILLEQGCAKFSNIHGLTYIEFPKGNLKPAFEEIRRVLEREGLCGRSVEDGTQPAAEGPSAAAAEATPLGLLSGGWYDGGTFGIPSIDGGTCSVLEVKNNIVEVPVYAKDVTARIEYWNAAGTKRFVVAVATWWDMIPDRAKGSGGWRHTVDVEAGASQCLILFVTKDNKMIAYRENIMPVGVIDYGKWNILIQVSSENVEGFETTLSFTLARDGLRNYGFGGQRRLPPRSAAAGQPSKSATQHERGSEPSGIRSGS